MEAIRGTSQFGGSRWVTGASHQKIARPQPDTFHPVVSFIIGGGCNCNDRWVKAEVAGTMATHPGVYCLRSNELSWDEEKLWRTYTMLTDLESVFRSLKSELGLRPVFHSKEYRSDGHLFITVLAYQCVQAIRVNLKKAGIDDSWTQLRDTLAVQRRVTTSLRRKDGRTIHVRKSTWAEPDLMAIYQSLAINPAPGGIKKLIS